MEPLGSGARMAWYVLVALVAMSGRDIAKSSISTRSDHNEQSAVPAIKMKPATPQTTGNQEGHRLINHSSERAFGCFGFDSPS
jgi:hypothetical protein